MGDLPPYYVGGWKPYNKGVQPFPSVLEMNVTRVLGWRRSTPLALGPGLALADAQRMQCEAVLGDYEILLSYNDGIRTASYQFNNKSTLQNAFERKAFPGRVAYNETWGNTEYRNLDLINYFALLDSVVMVLTGSYDVTSLSSNQKNVSQYAATLANGTTLYFNPMAAPVNVWKKELRKLDAAVHPLL